MPSSWEEGIFILYGILVRLALVVKELHCGRWKRRVPVVAKVKHFLYVLFEERFGDG